MTFSVEQPRVDELENVIKMLRSWQFDGSPVQLHPGDLGWFWRFGPDELARALRVWTRNEQIFAVGLLDEPDLLRLAVAPAVDTDEEFAHQLVSDLMRPEQGVLPPGTAYVEARSGESVRKLLLEAGWAPDESWTPLSRSLSNPVERPEIRIEVVDAGLVASRVAVQRAAFPNSTFTEDRWLTMASGAAYADARCLLGFDASDTAVAAITVWSAGVGRPGLIEPMGVHHDHRRRGYARAITLAGAAALRELGSSSAVVCTRTQNVAAVAAYKSAGLRALPDVRDWRRDA